MKTMMLFVCSMVLIPMTASESFAQATTKTVNGRQYTFVRGAFTQRDAWREAERRGGYPVVFETLKEHTLVVTAFGLGRREVDVAWTGHFQSPYGVEPNGGWTTYGNRSSAPIYQLFNGNGPDDGITRTSPAGKNEDAGVIWKDNNGLLEDVSDNYRTNVLIEYR